MASTARDVFGTGTVMRLTGATARQLDYWAWTGPLGPTQPGQQEWRDDSRQSPATVGGPRQYTFSDLVHLRVAMRLKEQGMTLQMARRAVERLREHAGDALASLSLVVVDGDVRVYRSRREAHEATQGRGMYLFMDIGQVATELQHALSVEATRPRGRRHPAA